MSFFSKLGLEEDVSDELMAAAESYVCALYGKPKFKNVNEARAKIFWDKYNKKKRIIELSLLPPCKTNLHLHVKRANHVARLMRTCSRFQNNEFAKHGWTDNGEPIWAKEHVPDNIKEILLNSDVGDDDDDEGLLDEENEGDGETHEDEDEDVELADYS